MAVESINTICLIEELAANAWPAAVVQHIDGWRARFNSGVTRRANSVWPNQRGDRHTLLALLAWIEDFYVRRGVPARVHISPAAQPAELDGILQSRNYQAVAHTLVQVAALDTVLERTAAAVDMVDLDETINEAWLACYRAAEEMTTTEAEARRDIMERIGPPAVFATCRRNAQPIAVGFGVVERGWVGIFGMATQLAFRRQGAATAVIRGIAQWAQQRDATQMYVQVMQRNLPAQALYGRLGFETLYTYHYREFRTNGAN